MIMDFAWDSNTGGYVAHFKLKSGKEVFRNVYDSKYGYFIKTNGINHFLTGEEIEKFEKLRSYIKNN